MLNNVDLNKVYAKFLLDVDQKAIEDKSFTVGDVVGTLWEHPYTLVWNHYGCDWHTSRTQLGKIISGFIPKINADLDITLKPRTVFRKGHYCTEYYFDITTDNPISKNKALLIIDFFRSNPDYVTDVTKYITYKEGAEAIDWHHRPMQWALGYIQTANRDLGNPPLQMLFVRGDTKEPGDSFDWRRCGWTSKAEMLAKRTEVANHVWDWNALATYIRSNL